MKIREMGYILVFVVCFFIIGLAEGLATEETSTTTGASSAGEGNQAKLQTEAPTVEGAKEHLAQLLTKRMTPVGIKYYGLPGINDFARLSDLTPLVPGFEAIHWDGNPPKQLKYILFKSLTVLPDRIQVSPRIYFLFSDLGDALIDVSRTENEEKYPHVVRFEKMSFHFHAMDLADAQKFAEDLRVIQKPLQKSWDERFASFKLKAAEYRAMKTKPPVSEEQRRFIVQANALAQKKEYARAIDIYRKAVEVDEISYPPAYYNLALLCAQENRFYSAISFMKQFLLLGPDPKDARSAQDKIYEWELETGK